VGRRLIAHLANNSAIELTSAAENWTEEELENLMHDPHEWPYKRWWQAADGSWLNPRHVVRIEVEKQTSEGREPSDHLKERLAEAVR
jgi:hypothetical protein